jgi:hypothetical protein
MAPELKETSTYIRKNLPFYEFLEGRKSGSQPCYKEE